MSEKEKAGPWEAKIISHVHDQGGGSSWCSECKTTLDLSKLRELNYVCPGCSRPLTFGPITTDGGGHDF